MVILGEQTVLAIDAICRQIVAVAVLFAFVTVASTLLGARSVGRAESALWRALFRRLPFRLLPLVAGLFSLAVNVSAGAVRFPRPFVHDEFSYLLAADTFAHGRLANPPHPFWQHFESFHVLCQPTYASKYPPGQGLALAAGQCLFGEPILGVWLVAAAGAAAACWMLRAWGLPSRWALLGACLLSLHPLVLRWSESFWGGGLPLLAGILLAGALRLWCDGQSARRAPGFALLAGVAAGILALCRPFEGAVATAAGSAAALALLRRRKDRATLPAAAFLLRRFACPFAAGVLPALIFLGFYNRAVTGNPFLLPYVVYSRSYDPCPLFLLQPPRPAPPYRHAALREFYLDSPYGVALYDRQRSPAGFATACRNKLEDLFKAAFTLSASPETQGDRGANAAARSLLPTGLLPVLALAPLPLLLRRSRGRAGLWGALAGGISVPLALLAATYCEPHYAAPAGAFWLVLGTVGLRALGTLRPAVGGKRLGGFWDGRRIGRGAARLIALCFVFSAIVFCRLSVVHGRIFWQHPRDGVEAALRQAPGRHLVFVRYGPNHVRGLEWVYNGADLATEKILWARVMGRKDNQRLAEYETGRTVWFVDADAAEPAKTLTLLRPAQAP